MHVLPGSPRTVLNGIASTPDSMASSQPGSEDNETPPIRQPSLTDLDLGEALLSALEPAETGPSANTPAAISQAGCKDDETALIRQPSLTDLDFAEALLSALEPAETGDLGEALLSALEPAETGDLGEALLSALEPAETGPSADTPAASSQAGSKDDETPLIRQPSLTDLDLAEALLSALEPAKTGDLGEALLSALGPAETGPSADTPAAISGSSMPLQTAPFLSSWQQAATSASPTPSHIVDGIHAAKGGNASGHKMSSFLERLQQQPDSSFGSAAAQNAAGDCAAESCTSPCWKMPSSWSMPSFLMRLQQQTADCGFRSAQQTPVLDAFLARYQKLAATVDSLPASSASGSGNARNCSADGDAVMYPKVRGT